MFDVLTMLGTPVVAKVIQTVISKALDWAKSKPKLPAAEAKEKVSDLVDKSLNKVIISGTIRNSTVTIEQRQQMHEEITRLVMPSFEEIISFDSTRRDVVSAAKRAAKKAAPKKAATKKSAAKKTSSKKTLAKRVARKR